jgi:hypothetical protein
MLRANGSHERRLKFKFITLEILQYAVWDKLTTCYVSNLRIPRNFNSEMHLSLESRLQFPLALGKLLWRYFKVSLTP